jgi:hypothetical protein
MRALVGAIIAAGAMLGLGLTALGIGTRYSGFSQGFGQRDSATHQVVRIPFGELDTSFQLALVVLMLMVGVGLVTAFIGLAFHHHRRHIELFGHHGPSVAPNLNATSTRVTTPP